MADLEQAVYTRLTTFAPLVALVADRVYPGSATQGAEYPFVTYQRISTPRFHAMGVDATTAGARFQLNVYARTENNTAYGGAKTVAAQVRAAMRRWKGTVAGVVVQDTMLENEMDLEAPDDRVHGVAIDIMIWHSE